MPPEGQVELAHPEAADWMLGNLRADQAVKFQQHLASCPHCQAAVAEFGVVGQMVQRLPPATEPPSGLEERTIARVLSAAAHHREAPQLHHVPAAPPADAEDQTGTQARQSQGATGTEPEAGTGGARIIRFPHWRSRTTLLAVTAVAAAVATAAAIVLSLPGSKGPGIIHAATVARFVLRSPSGGPAGGEATGTDHGPAGWSIRLRVHGLRASAGDQFYECWYVRGPQGHRQFVSGGTFTVGTSGAGSFTMWSGVDARHFRTMEITRQTPSNTGPGPVVVLTGQAHIG
jgi:hypothetical protein